MEKSNQMLLGAWDGPHCLISNTLSMKRHVKYSNYGASIWLSLKFCFPCSIIILYLTYSILTLAEGNTGGTWAKPLCIKSQHRSQCSADLSCCYTPNPWQINHTGLYVSAYHLSLTSELQLPFVVLSTKYKSSFLCVFSLILINMTHHEF